MTTTHAARARTALAEPVAVFGVGVEGRATIDYLLRTGVRRMAALDRNPIAELPTGVEGIFGDAHGRDLSRFATIFRSAGIRPDHPALEAARGAGSLVTSAVAHFLAECPAQVIGITGTLGKGTASTLAARMLEDAGFNVHLGGNIGRSPLDFLGEVRPDHKVVLEISSFQAMDLDVSPEVGVVLRTTSEHLDWHRDLAEYRSAKARLLFAQGPASTVIWNADSEGAREIARASAAGTRLGYSLLGRVRDGIHFSGDAAIRARGGIETPLPLDLHRLRIVGRFNLENIAAALLAAAAAGADPERSCAVAERFEGLPHRLEQVCEAGGVRFYDDSYATRPEAAIAAMGCFTAEPLAVILGGSEKHADFAELARAVHDHPTLAHVALIGATAGRLEAAIAAAGPLRATLATYADMETAMEGAVRALPRPGVVLLAPACASFGLFPNYKVRGERFRHKALALAAELTTGSCSQ